jgi:hypothetical protein
MEDNNKKGSEMVTLLAGAVGAAVAAGVVAIMSDKEKREKLGKMLTKAAVEGGKTVTKVKNTLDELSDQGEEKIDDAEEIVNQVMEVTRKELKKRLS